MLSLSRAHDAFATASGSRPAPSSDITATEHLHVHGWRHDDQGMLELSRSERRDGWPKSWMENLDRDTTIVDIEERYGPRQDSWWCSHNRDEAQLVESLRNEPLAVQQRQELDNRKIRQQAQALIDSREAQAALDRVQNVRKNPRTSIPTVANSPDVFQAPKEAAFASTSKLPFGTPIGRPAKRFATPTVDPQVAAKRRKKDTVSGKKALEREAALDEWKSKYTKAFPQFTFHFEYDAATHSKAKAAKAGIERLGGRIDQFFSKKITHLITLRPANAAKSAPLAPKDVNQDLKSRTVANSKNKGVKPLPRSPGKNPFIETGASAEVSDLAGKAMLMGIKVWPVSKLQEVVNLLCPAEEAPQRNQLSQLLEDERLYGTRERDAHAPRHDYYYFGKGNHYLLIEDALGLHRPVMAKEYERNSKTEAQWPVMYTDFLRVSEAVKAADDGTPPELQREKAWRMYVTRTGWNGQVAPAPYAADADGNLRRSSSLQSLHRRTSGRLSPNDVLPTPPPYQAASGNSVALTSNINSTCNGRTSLESGLGAFAQNKDMRVMQMSKRVQVLKGNASARMAAGMSTKLKLGTANRLEGADDELEVYDRPATPQPVTEIKPDRRFKSQKEVIALLRLSRQPAPCPQDVTIEERIEEHNRAWDAKDASFLATKSGYCENCRVKFESIEEHRKSRRHMRFAQDSENWHSLDEVLYRVRRKKKCILPYEPLSSLCADALFLEGDRYGEW